jgi:hypothetical protein
MSATRTGRFGKAGELNPMYGKVAGNPQAVYVYNLENELVQQFSSRVAAESWLGVSGTTVLKSIRTGKVFKTLYIIRDTKPSLM